MADVAYSELLDPAGELVWRGNREDRRDALKALGGNVVPALGALLDQEDLPSCERGEVMDAAERLGFVTRVGAARGFLTALPRATLVDQAIDAFNVDHLVELRANRIDFPLLFARADDEMRALTSSYEKQGRMFRLADEDSELRLAYAADPGVFAWLKDRCLDSRRLPYGVYTPLPVFRRWQSGEISLDRMRQYPVPDVHILTAPENATEVYEDAVRLAAENARFWGGEDVAHSLDIVEVPGRDPHLVARRLAQAGGCHTVVNVLRSRPRYYSVKGGLMIYAGFGPLMLYNFQLDDTNGARFRIHLEDGQPVEIVHATVAGGWPKLLPLVLGRGLTGVGPRVVPAELAWHQVVCVPVSDRHVPLAERTAARLREAGLRAVADDAASGPLGGRLRRLREAWQPLWAVIGDREEREEREEPLIESMDGKQSMPLDEFVAVYAPRLDRCRPAAGLHFADPPILA